MFTVTVGEDSISTTKYLGFEGSTSESNTRASAQRFCHFISIFWGSYPDPAAVALPGVICSATPAYPLFFFAELFLAPPFFVRVFFSVRLRVRRLPGPLRGVFALTFLFFSFFLCIEIFFFNPALGMQNPFSAAGACSCMPANSHHIATFRRSSPAS